MERAVRRRDVGRGATPWQGAFLVAGEAGAALLVGEGHEHLVVPSTRFFRYATDEAASVLTLEGGALATISAVGVYSTITRNPVL